MRNGAEKGSHDSSRPSCFCCPDQKLLKLKRPPEEQLTPDRLLSLAAVFPASCWLSSRTAGKNDQPAGTFHAFWEENKSGSNFRAQQTEEAAPRVSGWARIRLKVTISSKSPDSKHFPLKKQHCQCVLSFSPKSRLTGTGLLMLA